MRHEETASNANTIIEEVEGNEIAHMRDYSDNLSETRAYGSGGLGLNEGKNEWHMGSGRGKRGGHLEAMADRSAISDIPKVRGLGGSKGGLLMENG